MRRSSRVTRLGGGVALLLTVSLSGCADDVVPGLTVGQTGSSSGGSDTIDAAPSNLVTGVVDEGTSGGSGGSGGSSGNVDTTGTDTGTTDTTDTTGDPPSTAQTQSQLVSSGQVMSGSRFRMVYTLGQPTQLQSTHSSINYTMQGGLIGANGSPP